MTMIASWTTRSATTRIRIRRARVGEKPSTLRIAT
jgi:hypothetical protein